MHFKAPGCCPVCNKELKISKLTCNFCHTKLEGEFSACKFCRLPADQLEFLEVFIKSRGNIKDVEKELGISYPTVRNRLEGVIQALGYSVEKAEAENINDRRQEILAALEEGKISALEAAQLLRKIGK